MALLDMLCCGFGAAALLFVLAQGSRTDAISRLELAVRAEQQPLVAVTAAYDELVPLQHAIESQEQFSLLAEPASNLIVVVDTSTSMKWFALDEAESGQQPKWEWVRRIVGSLLVGTKGLEHFALVRLAEGSQSAGPMCSGCDLIGTSASPAWLSADVGTVASALRGLAAVEPAGGANHFPALTAAIDLASSRAPGDAVAVVLITDGLPNHGLRDSGAAIENGLFEQVCGATLHPPPGCWVLPEYKRQKAEFALRGLKAAMSRLHSERHFRLHVVAVPWPDDNELAVFGLELARAGRGTFVNQPRPSTSGS